VQRGTPFQIRGVVPIALTNFLSLHFAASSLFVVYGAFDNDVSGASEDVNPFFIYDHAQCPKAMLFEHNTLGQPATFSDTTAAAWSDGSSRSVSQNPHDSNMTQLVWSAPQRYTSTVDSRDVRSFGFLSLRLGQQYRSGATLNPANQLQDLLVTLVTAGGEAAVRVGTITDLPFPDQRPGQDAITKAAVKTVRIPLSAFAGINPALRLDAVTGVRLSFSIVPLGAISADDLEFTV
jgi:hypothetical protein